MAVEAVATTGITAGRNAPPPRCPTTRRPSSPPIAAEAAAIGHACAAALTGTCARLIEAPSAVQGAVSLISSGFPDRFDEAALADRVGYSPRQLRRLFERHVGATPDFVARSRRAHFARRLLDETDLSMTVIARAAGFGSVRQMNRVVEHIFRFPPQALRAKRRGRDVLAADGGLRLRIPTDSLLDVDQITTHLAPRLTPGVESLAGTVYRRTVATCGHPGVVEIDLAASANAVELTAHLPTFDSIIDDVARVRHMFGLDDDLTAAQAMLADDPALGRLIRRRPNLRVGGWTGSRSQCGSSLGNR